MDKKALAALAATPVTRASGSSNKTWVITDTGIKTGSSVGGQAGVIIRALAALGGTATSSQITDMINKMREEDPSVENIMAGKADQGTSSIVAHYSSEKTSLRKRGLVANG